MTDPAAAQAPEADRYAQRARDWRNGAVVYQVLVDRFAPSANLAAKQHLYPAPKKLRAWSEVPKAGSYVPSHQLYEGYGMTEDCAYSFTSNEQFNAPGYVGAKMKGVQARLSPEGEVLLKSPGQLVGYYKRPDLDAESFTEDGFFRTGDLGELSANGMLKLTGRAKELFKTAKGKYVAPAPLENRINSHPMIELSLVSGVGQVAAYGIVLLNETLRPRQHEASVRAEVTAELTRLLDEVNAASADYEQLKMLVNTAHFIMAELAIWMAGFTTVAIFPTETADTVGYVLGHSQASLLFVGKLDTWAQQKPGVPAGLPCIALPLAPQGHGFDAWEAITARTTGLKGQPQRAPQDLALLMYTSGSTGTPKGVMHSFERFSTACEGISQYLRENIGQNIDNRVLSYLPLSHIFERSWIEGAALVDGRTHIFFAEALDTFLADLQRARPTLFISVPRLWLKFQQGVFTKMPPAKLEKLLKIPILGKIVAKKLGADPGKRAARHAGGDGGNARFMPANAGVQQRGTSGADGARELQHLGPGTAVGNEIDEADAVDDDEVRPHRFAHTAHHLHRQAHAVFIAAAPGVVALVGVLHQKLVEEIAFAAHDLDAVIPGFSGQLGAAHEGANLAFDAALAQGPRREGRDGAFQAAGRDAERAVAIAP
ncbi:hypothetical protein B566_EDAN019060, partial [Ephemera danica]